MPAYANPADRDPTTLSVAEIHALIDRLTARAESIVLRDVPALQSDLRLAAQLIRSLLTAVQRATDETVTSSPEDEPS
jgi:hypothetical protein